MKPAALVIKCVEVDYVNNLNLYVGNVRSDKRSTAVRWLDSTF